MVSQTPRFTTCSIPECERPGVRAQSCRQCERHFCAPHLKSVHDIMRYHPCSPHWDDSDEYWFRELDREVQKLLRSFDLRELKKQASRLNNNKPCTFDSGYVGLSDSLLGSLNYHSWLEFSDKEKWLVRIPRGRFTDVPATLIEYLVKSEYATLKFLESTKIPSPKVYGYGLLSDPNNLAGVNYIFLENLPGSPYKYAELTTEAKNRVFEQLADISIEISKHPFPKAGSLIIGKDGRPEISAIASNRFNILGRYGPFSSAGDYWQNLVQQHLDLIADGQLYPKYPEEAYLFYTFLRENLHLMSSPSDDKRDNFYLKHGDDRGDHILVDREGNITGIIDWQFARAVPAIEAFGPGYTTADGSDLKDYTHTFAGSGVGQPGITEDDKLLAEKLRLKGAEDLALLMEGNEVARRFHHGLTVSVDDWGMSYLQNGSQMMVELRKYHVESFVKRTVKVFGGEEMGDYKMWKDALVRRLVDNRDMGWKKIVERDW